MSRLNAVMIKGDLCCPKCKRPLTYFSGLERMPAYLFCETCNDTAYDANTGKQIARLE